MSEDRLKIFHTAFIDFLDELIVQFPNEQGHFLKARLMVSTIITPQQLMNMFIANILPHKSQIKDRDEDFFVTKASVMFGDSSIVNHFNLLWKSSALTDEDRQIMWEWFDSFVLMATRYVDATTAI